MNKDIIQNKTDDSITSLSGEWISAEQENHDADTLAKAVFGSEENTRKTTGLIQQFVESYQRQKLDKPLAIWLTDEFRRYPDIWQDEAELVTTANEVINAVTVYEENRVSLYAHLDAGKSRESWLAKKLEQGAAATGVIQVGRYAGGIDQALEKANTDMWKTVTIQRNTDRYGEISNAFNLDGFIAEQHHADTFNIRAAELGSEYRAEVPKLNVKNSPDIIIRDGQGNEVKRYQLKYGATTEATEKLLNNGDYRDQAVVVSSDQAAQIEGATDVIEFDGIRSKPLSKAEAKAIQNQAQIEAEIREYEWNDVNRINVAGQISKQALIGATLTAALQGGRILGRRAWNTLNGRENPSSNEDLCEFFDSSIKSGTNVGVQVAVSGAVVVAARNGWMGALLKKTPAGRIANTVSMGLQNTKIIYQFAKGELNATEALDAMGTTTSSAVGGLAGAGLGWAQGALLGTLLGPVGTLVGGFVGGVLGGMAGSKVGQAVYEGGKVLARSAWDAVKTVGTGIKDGVKTLLSTLNPLRLFA